MRTPGDTKICEEESKDGDRPHRGCPDSHPMTPSQHCCQTAVGGEVVTQSPHNKIIPNTNRLAMILIIYYVSRSIVSVKANGGRRTTSRPSSFPTRKHLALRPKERQSSAAADGCPASPKPLPTSSICKRCHQKAV